MQQTVSIQPHMGNAFIKRAPLVSRNAKRQFMQEIQKVKDHFHTIDDLFLSELFHLNENEQDDYYHVTYKLLYHHYNEQWKCLCKAVQHIHKLKYLGVDMNWFRNNYYPTEKPY